MQRGKKNQQKGGLWRPTWLLRVSCGVTTPGEVTLKVLPKSQTGPGKIHTWGQESSLCPSLVSLSHTLDSYFQVFPNGGRDRCRQRSHRNGGRGGPGPALCGVPADKASKLGCIHKSLNTHAFHTHSRQIQFPNQGLTGNPPYSSVCLHVCVKCMCWVRNGLGS